MITPFSALGVCAEFGDEDEHEGGKNTDTLYIVFSHDILLRFSFSGLPSLFLSNTPRVRVGARWGLDGFGRKTVHSSNCPDVYLEQAPSCYEYQTSDTS